MERERKKLSPLSRKFRYVLKIKLGIEKKLILQISFSKSRLDKYLNINIQVSEKMLQYLKF